MELGLLVVVQVRVKGDPLEAANLCFTAAHLGAKGFMLGQRHRPALRPSLLGRRRAVAATRAGNSVGFIECMLAVCHLPVARMAGQVCCM